MAEYQFFHRCDHRNAHGDGDILVRVEGDRCCIADAVAGCDEFGGFASGFDAYMYRSVNCTSGRCIYRQLRGGRWSDSLHVFGDRRGAGVAERQFFNRRDHRHTHGDGGTYSFTLKVTDAASQTQSQSVTNLVVSPAALTLTCTAPLTAQVGVAYTASCTAAGGTIPYTYSVTGAAPAWLSINSSTGAITGTPTGTGTYSFTLKVTDAASNAQTYAVTNLVVSPAALTLTCNAPLAAQVGVAYTGSCTAGGGTIPYTYSVTGAAPAWLSINPSTGAITGTPTGTGTYSFTLKVTDAASNSQTYAVTNLVVSPAALTLTCNAPLTAQVGVAYTGSCTAGGGTIPYTYSVTGAAPAWLSVNPSTGALTGTPTGTGTYSFTLKVTDAASQTKTQAVTNLVVSRRG